MAREARIAVQAATAVAASAYPRRFGPRTRRVAALVAALRRSSRIRSPGSPRAETVPRAARQRL